MIENLVLRENEERKAIEINATPGGIPMNYQVLNETIHSAIKEGCDRIVLNNVCGQRFIAASLQGDLELIVNGLPGNDLGIFMDGPKILVNGNCEDQAGNTMNDGIIIIEGDAGDVIGLSARGGKIYIKENVGYRVGIHMKEYENKYPVLIFGGISRDFLGEYMAGGVIIALGLKFLSDGTITENEQPICGNELGTGIHRGKIVLRTDEDLESKLGVGAKIYEIKPDTRKVIEPYLKEFCEIFDIPYEIIWTKPFQVIKPISKRPFGGNYCGQII
jgi:glutamate synthase domain-containing protein 3